MRSNYNFRERVFEWGMSLGVLVWGILVLYSSPGLFDKDYYVLLHSVMDGYKWGIAAVAVGVLRLLFLAINGAWRPSAHMRALGGVFGVTVWGSLLLPNLVLDHNNPIAAIYATLLLMDLCVIIYASGDAKIADNSAKSRQGVLER